MNKGVAEMIMVLALVVPRQHTAVIIVTARPAVAHHDARHCALQGSSAGAFQVEYEGGHCHIKAPGDHPVVLQRGRPGTLGLREQAHAASDAYVGAALLVACWLGSPSEAGQQAALVALRTARKLRTTLEENRWLQRPNWTPYDRPTR
jgi:hypothetical protein